MSGCDDDDWIECCVFRTGDEFGLVGHLRGARVRLDWRARVWFRLGPRLGSGSVRGGVGFEV